MQVVELLISQLKEAPWNPNRMDEAMMGRLKQSIGRYGLVENLVVRPLGDSTYELLSGNQRLEVLRDLDMTTIPCVVVKLGDADARLLAAAMNRIGGEDDLGMKAKVLRQVLGSVSEEDVLALLPETTTSLQALVSVGQEEMADYLRAWQQAQAARLRHLTFQLTDTQLEVVEEALEQAVAGCMNESGTPNRRGTALTFICQAYLESKAGEA